MRDFLSLKILDRLRPALERLGCDYPVLRKIVQIKLTMDARRVPTVMMNNSRRNRQENVERNTFVRSLWLYGVMGIALLPFVLTSENYLFQMSIAFAILMFLVTTSMISDFSSVLLDVRDRAIVSTKPVTSKTVSLARTVHIFIYLSLLTATLAGPGLIGGLLRHGIGFFLLFLMLVVLADVFVLVVTALLYLLILNVFDGERLKDIINYVQIVLSITIILGYQVIGRSFAVFKLHIVFHAAWWQVLVPPFWFGSVFTWLPGGHAVGSAPGAEIVVLTALAIVVPCAMFALYIRLMPAFERRLEKLSTDTARNRKGSHVVLEWIAKLICRTDEERTLFQFSSWMMARERDFKLKVYPSLGLSIAFPFIFMLNPAMESSFHSLASSKWYLAIYMTALMIPTVVSMLKYSGKYKAAWIYQVTPISDLGSVYRGVLKAFLVRLLLPVYILESIVFTAIFGFSVIPHLLAAGLAILIYAVVCYWAMDKDLPFSKPFEVVQQGKRYLVLVLMLVIALLAIVHLLFTLIPFGIYIYIVILLVANVIIWALGFNTQRSATSG